MPASTAFVGSVPANYEEHLGPVLFEPYALDLVQRLKNNNIKDLLEIACGTGRVTNHLLSLVPENGQLVATDLNGGMLEIAKTKVPDPKIKWMVADAQDLPFDNNSFDHVVCQYGVMFFPDKARAFAEVYRVLAPGGRWLFNTWDSLDHNPRVAIIQTVMDDIMGNGAPDFFEKGPHAFFDAQEIEALLAAAGFRKINIATVKKAAHYNSAANFIKGFVAGSPLKMYLANKDEALQEEVRRKLIEQLSRQEAEYGTQVPMQALVCDCLK